MDWVISVGIVLFIFISLVAIMITVDNEYSYWEDLSLFGKFCEIWTYILIGLLAIVIFCFIVWGVHEMIVNGIYKGDV